MTNLFKLGRGLFDALPVLFLSQSSEPLGLQPESSATDFPLIYLKKGKGITQQLCLVKM